ncbi:H-type small acid-soluble spore protein [Haloplasma contractile]|uniref:Small acid-soluble spore protein H n=1 Tax=Haloplasma contractile SSD-17B TaxID=1033810 RepID=F7Q1Y9_9MOLU|nr:H-type small acid-soluble spore protein [Haloplasma contractile]ERJ12199.1 Small acid-soluble spore protein H [Haloplasma contractile SSD-17B]
MDARRAEEIIASRDTISVVYNGFDIYLEKVNNKQGTASIHFIDQPDKKQIVPLNDLIEY